MFEVFYISTGQDKMEPEEIDEMYDTYTGADKELRSKYSGWKA